MVGSDNQTQQLIVNSPKWADEDQFSIEAKAEDVTNVTQAELTEMVQALVNERFNLKFHWEARQVSALALVVAKDGAKLEEPTVKEDYPGSNRFVPALGQVIGQQASLWRLARFLSDRLGRLVVDRTGLNGVYDYTLSWSPDENEIAPNGAPVKASLGNAGPSLLTALEEQIGLRVEAQKVALDVLVIDSVQKPTVN